MSGRLKVAPEHTSSSVLSLMRKAPFDLFRKLKDKFDRINKKHSLNYEIIPYFISSHPGCTDAEMKELVAEMKNMGIQTGAGSGFHSDTHDTFCTVCITLVLILIRVKRYMLPEKWKRKKDKKSIFSGTGNQAGKNCRLAHFVNLLLDLNQTKIPFVLLNVKEVLQ